MKENYWPKAVVVISTPNRERVAMLSNPGHFSPQWLSLRTLSFPGSLLLFGKIQKQPALACLPACLPACLLGNEPTTTDLFVCLREPHTQAGRQAGRQHLHTRRRAVGYEYLALHVREATQRTVRQWVCYCIRTWWCWTFKSLNLHNNVIPRTLLSNLLQLFYCKH